MLKIKILGSGTSTGVPVIGCKCRVCQSKDLKDKRLRTSIYVQSEETSILIDTTPDLRQQCLSYNIDKLDAVIYTHHHYDHIGGFDDLRGFNFALGKPVDIYLMEETLNNIQQIFPYAFNNQFNESSSPVVKHCIIKEKKFKVGDIELEPISLLHGKMKVLGFRIGDFAYCTDCNFISDDSLAKLKNLECIIIDGLRFERHLTHFSINEAVEIINYLKPKKAYLTHLSHDIMHKEVENNLPKTIYLAYDGLEIIIE